MRESKKKRLFMSGVICRWTIEQIYRIFASADADSLYFPTFQQVNEKGTLKSVSFCVSLLKYWDVVVLRILIQYNLIFIV